MPSIRMFFMKMILNRNFLKLFSQISISLKANEQNVIKYASNMKQHITNTPRRNAFRMKQNERCALVKIKMGFFKFSICFGLVSLKIFSLGSV